MSASRLLFPLSAATSARRIPVPHRHEAPLQPAVGEERERTGHALDFAGDLPSPGPFQRRGASLCAASVGCARTASVRCARTRRRSKPGTGMASTSSACRMVSRTSSRRLRARTAASTWLESVHCRAWALTSPSRRTRSSRRSNSNRSAPPSTNRPAELAEHRVVESDVLRVILYRLILKLGDLEDDDDDGAGAGVAVRR
jgi:hypothetical protein